MYTVIYEAGDSINLQKPRKISVLNLILSYLQERNM